MRLAIIKVAGSLSPLFVVNSSLALALHARDDETTLGLSDDGFSYADTVVRGVLREGSE